MEITGTKSRRSRAGAGFDSFGAGLVNDISDSLLDNTVNVKLDKSLNKDIETGFPDSEDNYASIRELFPEQNNDNNDVPVRDRKAEKNGHLKTDKPYKNERVQGNNIGNYFATSHDIDGKFSNNADIPTMHTSKSSSSSITGSSSISEVQPQSTLRKDTYINGYDTSSRRNENIKPLSNNEFNHISGRDTLYRELLGWPNQFNGQDSFDNSNNNGNFLDNSGFNQFNAKDLSSGRTLNSGVIYADDPPIHTVGNVNRALYKPRNAYPRKDSIKATGYNNYDSISGAGRQLVNTEPFPVTNNNNYFDNNGLEYSYPTSNERDNRDINIVTDYIEKPQATSTRNTFGKSGGFGNQNVISDIYVVQPHQKERSSEMYGSRHEPGNIEKFVDPVSVIPISDTFPQLYNYGVNSFPQRRSTVDVNSLTQATRQTNSPIDANFGNNFNNQHNFDTSNKVHSVPRNYDHSKLPNRPPHRSGASGNSFAQSTNANENMLGRGIVGHTNFDSNQVSPSNYDNFFDSGRQHSNADQISY